MTQTPGLNVKKLLTSVIYKRLF